MKFGTLSPVGCAFLVTVLFLLPATAGAQSKFIRLRQQTIATTTAEKAAAAAQARLSGSASAAPASGLFLVQLETHLDPARRQALRGLGVQLVKYVPDDAFIAAFNQVAPDRVRALDFVRWVGPYRPDYKIHPRLAAAVQGAAPAAQSVPVSVMLSPGASPADVAGVRSLLSAVEQESRLRQGIILRGTLPPGRLEALAQSAAVVWIEPAPRRKLVDELAAKVVGGDDGRTGTPTLTQQRGYGGAGVTICIADTGLDTGNTNTMHPDLRGRVTGFKYYGYLTDAADEYGHGTHCAGIAAGNAATHETDPATGAFYGLGVASGARLFIERLFDADANEVSPAPSDADLAGDAVRAGAQIGANSWGNDVAGEYDTDAAQFDELVRDADASTPGDQPYILEFSAGNAGPDSQTMDSPASGKNVIATGAAENVSGSLSQTYGLYDDGPDAMADFSSRGPCEDARIKPDVVAPGTWIASLASSAALNLAAVVWSPIDNYYVYMGGTSMSGQFAGGAAAVFVQYYKSYHTNAVPSPALVKAALINSADEMLELNGGPGPIPNNDEGWGRIDLANIIVTNFNTAPRFYQFVDQTASLTDGQVWEQHAFVRSSTQPLKITLAYTDVPGFPGAIPALVNDLDLEVVAPDGTRYLGNQFTGNESVPNAAIPDNLNNVEGVQLARPVSGDYLVRVRARSVVEDARLDTADVDQDFALVVSGDLVRPGAGLVVLDRTNYTAPGVMRVEVLDPARAASNTVHVLVKSTTEPAGETYTLQSAGNYGAFTAAVVTVAGAATVDGKLEVHHGNAIEADYVDALGSMRTATALADLVPPAITGVAATLDLGVVTITWQTSEPADTIVRYGLRQPLARAVTNSTLVTSHSIRLSDLIPGKTYRYLVSSRDAAGNATTNDNAGAYYSFVAVATPTVLLVDAYEEAEDSPVIPDSTYTNALASAGFTCGFWKVMQRGPPQLADLQPFRIVIWRTTDDLINYTGTNNTLTPAQQFMIQNYLNGGGSFFMASMGILTQLGNVPFRKNVLQVAGFKQNPDPPSPCQDCDEDFQVPSIIGAADNPITSGLFATLNYGNYPIFEVDEETVLGPDFSDTFTPGANARAILFEPVSGKPCGMSYPRVGVDSPGRVVFLSFPLDTVPAGGTPPNTEAVLLRNILNFLAPGVNGVGTIFLDRKSYTVPDQVTIEVGDLDLVGAGPAQATFATSSSTNRATVTLNETTHPGLFRGYLTLVATNPNGTNELVVHNGDVLTAQYFDASNGSNIVATATVDTVPPVITQVTATPGIGDAVVTWKTSKPADSLVQYSESTQLDQSAYAAPLVTNHSVSVGGLSANRAYHYQVVSRDAAGNTTVDDNHGALYTFTTQGAPQPPWFDNLESGAPGWTVVPDPVYGSDINWTLGTPRNGLQTSGYSGTNAWGSDLDGQQIPLIASSFLYSPLIDLSGLSQATLTFWDCFDFSTGLEQGQVMICTNRNAAPASLPVLFDFSGDDATDWRQETIDLTPYVGKTVQVVWDYAGVSIGSPTYGWLVDDVLITGLSAGAGGTIVVSKNISQGNFTLTGPVVRSGSALLTTISNAPPGRYTVRFSDVAFYQTPLAQVKSLLGPGTLNFTGNYTFTDTNANGISDAAERYYFGDVSTNRTPFTDTDHDGMSDYAEFIAGTNPTNAASRFVILSVSVQTNRTVQLKWAAIPGRIYQVQNSTNLVTWSAVSDWLQAPGSPLSFIQTNASRSPQFFRVQVRP